MQIRFEALPRPPKLPESYVHVAFYGGTSNFPMGSFYVLSEWWNRFKTDPEIVITPEEPRGTVTVETWPAAGKLAAQLFNDLKEPERP